MQEEIDKLNKILTAIAEKAMNLIVEGEEMDERHGDGMVEAADAILNAPGFREWRKEQEKKKTAQPSS